MLDLIYRLAIEVESRTDLMKELLEIVPIDELIVAIIIRVCYVEVNRSDSLYFLSAIDIISIELIGGTLD